MGKDPKIPLCVDLDGTLVKADTLHENLLSLCARDPRHLLALPAWLAKGRAQFKREVADRVELGPDLLPYRDSVLALIEEAKAAGRPVILTTAAPRRMAEAVAAHLGHFDEVIASDDGDNVSAERKAALLEERFGAQGFDYVGDAKADLPVFQRARRAYLISSRGRLRRSAAKHHPEPEFLDGGRAGLRTWARVLRVHQWLKNLLVFLPLVAAHRLTDPHLLGQSLLAFAAFSLCASSVYIVNDLVDLQSDRAHRSKRRRPFAAGDVPVAVGVVVAPLLLIAAFAIAALTSTPFLLVLLGYFLLTSLYSFWLKRQVIVDVIILTILYTARIIAGGAATGIPLSFWILVFSMFLFLSLALLKRFSELRLAVESGRNPAGRGYWTSDLPVLMSLGSGSGIVSVLVLALYIASEGVSDRYPASRWLWLPPLFVLYWLTRMWMKANRGEVNEDPVLFAARDWQSLVIAGLVGIAFILASVGPAL